MSGFHLVPLDGGDPVHLPAGETVLGRGPFLGISDKRISRNHCLLQNLSGQLRLKPTHVNPCFVQAAPTDEPRPLQKDSWYRLQHGELLSLLPGHFAYRVEALDGDQRPPSQRSEDEALPGAAPAADRGDEEADGPGRSLSQEDVCPDEKPSEHRRRVLPAWMMAVVSAPKTPPSIARAQSATKGRKQPPVPSAQATPTAASSHKEAELNGEEDEERPRKKRRELNDDAEKPQTKTGVLSGRSTVSYHPKTSRSEVDDQSDQFAMEVGAEGGGDASPRLSEVSGSKEKKKKVSVPTPSKPARTPCPYGKDCYRTHFTSRSAVTPEMLTTKRKRKRIQIDPSVRTEPTATGRTLFTGRTTSTPRDQLAPLELRPKTPPTMTETSTTTVSSTTTARAAATRTTPLRPLTTARRRTWSDCREKPRPSCRGGSRSCFLAF